VSTGFASHRRFQLFGCPERHLFAGAIAPSHRWLDCAPCAPGNPLPLDDAQAAHTHPFFRLFTEQVSSIAKRDRLALILRQANEIKFVMVPCR
jgi:hypothetical protein